MTNTSQDLVEIPESWMWVNSGEVCEGIVPGRTKPKNFNGDIPWITLPDIDGLYISRSKKDLAVSVDEAMTVGMKVMPKDTVLMSCVGQFGLICIASNPVVPNQQFHGLLCLDNILPEYIAYALKTQVAQMEQMASATTISYLNKTKCNSINIPLAPLNEQRRIVAKIEELRAHTLRSQQALDEIPALIDQFRQSVLATAFRGDLTADWRKKNPDVEPAEKLLERIRKERRQKWEEVCNLANEKGERKPKAPKENNDAIEVDNLPQIPPNWRWERLVNLANLLGGVTKGRKFKDSDTIYAPYLRVANVQDGFLDLEEIKEIEVLPEDIDKYKLHEGDVLFTEGGDRDKLGRGTVWANEIKDCIHQNHVYRTRLDSIQVLPEYVSLAAKTEYSKDYFFNNASQTVNLASINITTLGKLPIPIPPTAEQKAICDRIHHAFKVIDTLSYAYQTAIEDSDTLNQSILAKAFRGELVPQDPNDEPASALLDRIRAEREKLGTTKTQKRSSRKRTQQQ